MTTSLNLLRYPALLLCLSFLLSCAGFDEVDMTGIKNVSIKNATAKTVVLDITVGINNPNNRNFKITRAKLDVEIDGKPVGIAKLMKKVKIHKNSHQDYHILLECQTESTVLLGFNALASLISSKSMSVNAKGKVKACSGIYFKTFDVDIREQL